MKRGVTCTKELPDREAQIHPDAKESGEQKDGWPGGDFQGYKCPNCGLYFEMELPQ
jgi:hypothetical protein